jgi:hypothetical protein
MKPTIITLAPDVQVEGVSFEEAFGEHSEARGKKRTERVKARQAAKRERIAARAETRKAKQEARKERKVGRQEVRQATKEARVAKRQAAQQARMGKRQAAMEARQTRRTTRKQMRTDRRAIGEEQEPVNENGMVMGEEPQMPTPQMEMPEQEPQGFNEEPMAETSEPQVGEGGYAPQPTYMNPPQRGTEYQEEVGMYGESDSEMGNEETGEEPLGDNDEYSDEESSFDAETTDGSASSFDAENYDSLDGDYDSLDGDYSEAGGQAKLVSVRKRRLKNVSNIDNRISVLNDKIKLHENQASNLKTALRTGKMPSNKVAMGAKELRARALHLEALKAKLEQAQKAKAKQGVVPVAPSLDAKIEPNKIVIPAASADGVENYMFEGESSFDGKSFWDKNKGVIIGLGIAGIAIYALNKYKVFK